MLSGIVTAVLLVAFVGATIWAWSGKRKSLFDAAARLPLDEAEPQGELPRAGCSPPP